MVTQNSKSAVIFIILSLLYKLMLIESKIYISNTPQKLNILISAVIHFKFKLHELYHGLEPMSGWLLVPTHDISG